MINGTPVKNVPTQATPSPARCIRRAVPFAAAVLCALLLWLAPAYPELVDLYSRHIFPVFAFLLSSVSSLIPVSLCEIFIWIFVLAAPVSILFLARVALRRRRARQASVEGTLSRYGADAGASAGASENDGREETASRAGETMPPPHSIGPQEGYQKRKSKKMLSAPRVALQAFFLVFVAYTLLCGLNYHRPTFASMSGLMVRDSSAQELAALCRELAMQANEQAKQVARDRNGISQLDADIGETMRRGRETFNAMSARYAFLPELPVLPKPVSTPNVMSFLQVTGVYFPYTCEANINVQAPPYNIPSTICHELAHTRGFMREDEANFIAYLACRESSYGEFRYSGTMLALVHSMNKLFEADRTLHREVNALLSGEVRADFQYNNVYWKAFETPAGDIATAVNDVYLQVNNQSDGVRSYGRMTDLLLADYRARHGESDT